MADLQPIISTVNCKDVDEFPGYRIGDDGFAWSNRGSRGKSWRRLKSLPDANRHFKLALRKDGKTYWRSVHRLVLEVFIGPCPEGMECRHLDGNPANNRLDNLAWGTAKENQADRVIHGTDNRGARNASAKLDPEKVRRLFSMRADGATFEAIGAALGVTASLACRVIKGKAWKHLAEFIHADAFNEGMNR